jgi:hypothetical protein
MSTLNRTMTAYAQEALNAFTAALTPLNAFSRDFSAAAVQKGTAVAVPRYDSVTATTFASSYVGTGGTVNTVTVTVSNHRVVTVDLTDVQQLNTDVVIAKFAKQQGKALATLIQQDIWSLLTTVNFGLGVLSVSASAFSASNALTARKALALANAADGSSLVLNETAYHALAGDSGIMAAYAYGGSEAIREGKIPKVWGMPVFASNVLPTNSISLMGFVAHPDSIAVAIRTFDAVVPDGAYEYFDTVTDDATGLALGVRVLYEPETGKRFGSFECLCGYAVALSTGLDLIQSLD